MLRINEELDAASAIGLFELHPDHCVIEGIHVYAVGLACAKIEAAFGSREENASKQNLEFRF